jgi:hypothetical protein
LLDGWRVCSPRFALLAFPLVCQPAIPAAAGSCQTTSDSRFDTDCSSDLPRIPSSTAHPHRPSHGWPSPVDMLPAPHVWKYKTVLLYPRRSSPCGLPAA